VQLRPRMAYDPQSGIDLQNEIESKLPEFAKAVRCAADTVAIYQDAFAVDLKPGEFALLGKAIKYAGLLGKRVEIHGRHRETLSG
jgi:hypothetical protein